MTTQVEKVIPKTAVSSVEVQHQPLGDGKFSQPSAMKKPPTLTTNGWTTELRVDQNQAPGAVTLIFKISGRGGQ